MSGIFISYRRADSALVAGRIYERLKATYPEPVFRDIESIEAGADFADVLRQEIQNCDVLIAVIGPEWVRLLHENERAGHDDFVTLEVGEALRAGKYCVPVLVEGAREKGANARPKLATIPKSDQLPAELVPLLKKNAFEIRHGAFGPDVDRLINDIDPYVRDIKTRVRRLARRMSTVGLLAVAAAIAITTALIVNLWPEPTRTMQPGGVDIAVAGWNVISEDDGLDLQTIGIELGNEVATAIDPDFDPSGAIDESKVDELWGAGAVGIVDGATSADLGQAARQRGFEIGADLIVYGQATQVSNGTFEVSMSFALLGDDERRTTYPRFFEQTFIGAATVDLERLRAGEIAAIMPEVGLLTTMIDGLRHLDVDDIDAAISSFETLLDLPSEQQQYAAHVLLGLAYGRKAEIGNPDENLRRAAEYYEAAQPLIADATAADLGVLSIQYLAAIRSNNHAELALTRDGYQDVLFRSPGNPILQSLANTMLGQIDHAFAVAPDGVATEYAGVEATELLDRAEARFTTVVADYEEADDVDKVELKLIASGAHAAMALVFVERGELDSAIESYRSAQRLSSPFWRATYGIDIAIVHLEMGDACASAEEFDLALPELRSRSYTDPARLDIIEMLRSEADRQCA